tara:strand:- start:179 stop:433 length:255 start_codon:yes stop_codon:yes gene_type:complete
MVIENGDLPASPSSLDIAEYVGTINCSYNKPLTGLTKREAFAMAAMQGMIASGICTPPQDQTIHHMTSMASVSYADALLKELAK